MASGFGKRDDGFSASPALTPDRSRPWQVVAAVALIAFVWAVGLGAMVRATMSTGPVNARS